MPADRGHPCAMGTKSRETIYGSSIRASAERAAEARKQADRLACEAWNQRMLGFQGPAQPSPALGDALNAGYLYLEVRCLGCDTIRPLRWTSCAGRRRRRSMNWSATCGARTARRSGAIRTSAATWWRCGRPRFRRAIRPRRGGRASGESSFDGTEANVSVATAPAGTERLDAQWINIRVPDVGGLIAAVARPSRGRRPQAGGDRQRDRGGAGWPDLFELVNGNRSTQHFISKMACRSNKGETNLRLSRSPRIYVP